MNKKQIRRTNLMGMDSEGNFYCDERCNNLIMESTEFKNFINELKQKKESSNEIKCNKCGAVHHITDVKISNSGEIIEVHEIIS